MNITSPTLHQSSLGLTLTHDDLIPRSIRYPFYYSTSPSLIPGLTDKNISLLAPTLVYWAYAFVFVFLDTRSWAWLTKCRIETPDHLRARPQPTKAHVASYVLIQQALGVFLTILTVDENHGNIWPADHRDGMKLIAPWVVKAFELALGGATTNSLFKAFGPSIIEFTYWWAIPIGQILLAFFVMETWQFWIHYFSHVNKFVMRHFHSIHHELHAPYAFAALYAHPVEALVLNIFGAALGFNVPHLTTRQGIFLFVFSTTKAVDDHSGYSWPRFGPFNLFCLNPFQCIFGESSIFHDYHHATEGSKHNFSQPFTAFWDRVCGTYEDPHLKDAQHAIKLEEMKKLKSL